MKLIPVGRSNQVFYYLYGGEKAGFDLAYFVDLQENVDKGALAQAANKAIANFPEFAIRPVLHEGGL